MDALAVGIKVCVSDLTQITCNTVTVCSCGDTFTLAFGIKVFTSQKVCVSGNTVCVIAGGINNYCGFLLAEGIWLGNCSESFVEDNCVDVTGASSFNSNAGSFCLGFDDEQTAFDADIADINQVISQITQGSISVTLGAAIVVGIKVTNYDDCGLNAVIGNDVDVQLAADFIAGATDIASAAGAGVAFGIFGCGTDKLVVHGNTVNVDKAPAPWRVTGIDPDVMMIVRVQNVETLTEDIYAPIGTGLGLNLVLGITTYDCDISVVDCNSVYAAGTMNIEVDSAPTWGEMSSGSAISVLNSQILSSIYDSINSSVNSESINAQFNGSLPSIETFDLGGGLCAGIAILVIDSEGACVVNNPQAQGSGDITGKPRPLPPAAI